MTELVKPPGNYFIIAHKDMIYIAERIRNKIHWSTMPTDPFIRFAVDVVVSDNRRVPLTVRKACTL